MGATRTGDAVVIAGAGQAGFQAAASLRDEGFEGRIQLIGEEPGLPYQRPPLSKAFLTGKADRQALNLRAEGYFAQHGVEIVEDRVVRVERGARRVELAGGGGVAYDHLILATGARNRLLPVPGAELDGVFYLRSIADAERLRARLEGRGRAVVIGAGFIGLEFAAVAAAAGLAVTVLEATSRPMSRALSGPMSDFFRTAHERSGVGLVFGAVVTRIDGEGGGVSAVRTADGGIFPADIVLVGIGIVPNIEIAAEAGLRVENGIVVDEGLLTADPAVSAIGDCAAYPQPFAGGACMRLESVQNAIDHGRCVASRLVGRPRAYRAVPWFWSDQGSYKLQIAGLGRPHADLVVRGEASSGAFSVFCFEGSALVSVESVNKPADHMLARRLLAAGTSLTREQAADPTIGAKELAGLAQAAA